MIKQCKFSFTSLIIKESIFKKMRVCPSLYETNQKTVLKDRE